VENSTITMGSDLKNQFYILQQGIIVQTVGVLKNLHQADLVVLLSDGNYFDAAGVAFLGPDPALPFAMVEVKNSVTADHTFAHEVAHLFGCRHREDDLLAVGTARGHRFKTKLKTRRTIMQAFVGTNPILHYSNPNVNFKGVATGTTDRNNAAQLSLTGCTVANFMPNFAIFNTTISSTTSGCNIQATTTPRCASGTLGYEWYISRDGINWSNLFVNSSTLYHTVNVPGTYILKSVVIDGVGNSTYDRQFLYVNCAGFRGNGSNAPQNYMIKKIYPNPTATDDVTVVVEMEQTENVQLYITDINGNYKKMVTDQEMTTGKNTFTFKVTDLVAGSYHLNLRTENKEEYHLLIIKK
jgi:hypothetical protein